MSPIARWAVFLLAVLFWPFFTLPYWLLRYGAWGPGAAGMRILAFVGGALINPLLLVIVLIMWTRRAVTSWEPEWPMEFPGVIPDRSTTRVGTENARRNPQRTASTAAALMIGLALVTLVATLAAGIIASFEDAVNDLFSSVDYAITAQNNFSPIPIDAAEAAAKAPGVDGDRERPHGRGARLRRHDRSRRPSTRHGAGDRRSTGRTARRTCLREPRRRRRVRRRLVRRRPRPRGRLADRASRSPNGDDEDVRGEGHLRPADGRLAVRQRDDLDRGLGQRDVQQPRNLYSFVKMEGGETDANQAALDKALADFPNAKAQTRQQFIDNQISGLSSVLNILYVLLALSVIVSLFGIVNTLVLTVFERTREIGMLRAIGMTRRQVRRMIRHESVITALIGAALGIVLGIVLAALLIARVDFLVFSFPTTQVIIFVIAAIVVGHRRGDLPGAASRQARSAPRYRVRMTPSAASASISASE